jgi:hypothetical protein
MKKKFFLNLKLSFLSYNVKLGIYFYCSSSATHNKFKVLVAF